MALSKRLRFEVMRRDNYTCRYCGGIAPDVKLTVDHVVPSTLGGGDTADNLVAACADCNSGKTSSSPDEHVVASVSEAAVLWAEAMKIAAQKMRDDHQMVEQYRDYFMCEWQRWGSGEGANRQPVPLPPGWKQSIDNFAEAGLDAWVFEDAIDYAMANQKVRNEDKFRYVCGICWKKVAELQKNARTHVDAPESGDAEERHCFDEDCSVHNGEPGEREACFICDQENCDWLCGYCAGLAEADRIRSHEDGEDKDVRIIRDNDPRQFENETVIRTHIPQTVWSDVRYAYKVMSALAAHVDGSHSARGAA